MYLVCYNISIWLYKTSIRVAAAWNQKARKWVDGRESVFQELQARMQPGKPIIWMHCSSLGEFEQGRPVLEKISKENPGYKTLITFFSPSGFEVRKNYAGADHIFYLPLGTHATARRFVEIVNPSLVLWIKYEYWYHYLVVLKEKEIPVLLVSAIFRKEQPFFKWYGKLHREMLLCFTHFFVQTSSSKTLLSTIGFNKDITVNGDTRFDRVIEIAENAKSIETIDKFCRDHVTIVAGSTWPEDEEELDHYANQHPEIRFIIAPHEIDEKHLVEIEKLFKASVRYSVLNEKGSAAAVGINTLIIDNIGMLSRLYKYATITYVGGAFGNDGVHNVLEAAVYGKPVIFGPVFEKYSEAIDLVENGGGFSVETAVELEQIFTKLLSDQQLYEKTCDASRQYIYNNKGASERIVRYIRREGLI